MRYFGLKSKWCSHVDVFWYSRLSRRTSFFFRTHLCTLWRRKKPLIRPPQEFASYTGLFATFRALSHDRWIEPGFFFSAFLLLMICGFPVSFWKFCTEQICKGYYVIFPNSSLILNHEYIIVVSSLEEPSKIFSTLNEWPLSSVGRGTLQVGINFPSGFSVSAVA